jgi:hypothetical protein
MSGIEGTTNVVATLLNNSITCTDNETLHWGCEPAAPIVIGTPGDRGVGAASCQFSPCVVSYKASIAAGILAEQVVATTTVWGETNIIINKACLPPDTQNQLLMLPLTNETNGWLTNPNLNGTDPFEQTTPAYWVAGNQPSDPNITVPAECVYINDQEFTNPGINSYLSTYFNGSVGIVDRANYWYEYAGQPQILTIYNNGNLRFKDLNDTFANISSAITHYIRNNGYQNYSTPAYGTVLLQQACVSVRWAWLAYPAMLVVLTLVLFLATIHETRKGETRDHD